MWSAAFRMGDERRGVAVFGWDFDLLVDHGRFNVILMEDIPAAAY